MKRITLILVALILTLSLKAQWSLGTAGGLTYGELSLQDEYVVNGISIDDHFDKNLGWLFELSPGYAFNEHFRLDFQMRRSMRQYETQYNPQFGSKDRLFHAGVSPMVEWKFLPFMALAAGPVAEYLLLDQFRPGDRSGDWNDTDSGITEQFNFGINTGMHFFWRQFFMKCQYHHGLNDIQGIQLTDNIGMPTEVAGIQMRSWSLALGYRWHFHKKGSSN